MNLKVRFGKLEFKNPVMAASGTFGYAGEYKELVNLKKLGAIITKTITLKPRQGNHQPRLVETASGMLNSIGLQNEGVDNFLKFKLPYLKKIGTEIIVSISGETIEEFVLLAKRFENTGIKSLELNLSCPNVRNAKCLPARQAGKMQNAKLISQDVKATYRVVKAVHNATKKTIIAKLSPNVTDIVPIACAAEQAGADAVSLVNTLIGMAIDVRTRRPKLANITGGLSGPAIKPVALRMVYESSKAVRIPIIGMGGIMNTEDALEFLMAGSSAVCVGTANFVNPRVSIEIIDGLIKYLKSNRINAIKEITGSLKI